MSLAARLADQIRQSGPITVAAFMTACLHDPKHGYYATRPRLGADGDFITAPMISQMFGEMLGVWVVETWRRLGRPPRVVLVEVGPGDGTLMSDILRALLVDPDLVAALDVWLVETSAPLVEAQRARLEGATGGPKWVRTLSDAPADAPMILIANEVLDCLPARQFVRTPSGWAERMVGLDEAGRLAFGLAPAPGVSAQAPLGAVFELSLAQTAFAAEVGARVATQGGAALLIDYGRDADGFGDTLQALRGHQKVEPLVSAGEADLTVHADFPAVSAAAMAAGADSHILGQGEFLRRLGIEARAAVLAVGRPDQAGVLARQLARLIADDEMGSLFKVACLYARGQTPPPGFETTDV